ncbi:BNLF2a [Macacine gammaherpesvirus 4]|uniref:BNLF2a n=1 Tax=Macacine gammaherpesvirus 4 TaxID=45455 RepID=Q8UZC8_9GAMA|nr:BNLF2a [Macacine gammaherpesvirus 4]AAK95483.1 BNLF2a [Macacine gammaherpesvirus 4]
MVFFLNPGFLEQRYPAYGLPGSSEGQKPSHCPVKEELKNLRICLVVLCALFGLVCLLLI